MRFRVSLLLLAFICLPGKAGEPLRRQIQAIADKTPAQVGVAVLVKDSKLSLRDTEKIIADISEAVYRYLSDR